MKIELYAVQIQNTVLKYSEIGELIYVLAFFWVPLVFLDTLKSEPVPVSL